MHNCLVCGTELNPDWTECGECQTPVPESYRETPTEPIAPAAPPPEPEAAPVTADPPEPSAPLAAAPAARTTSAGGGAHHCLVCGAEVQPGWAECGECQTPVPESYRETTMQPLVEPAAAPSPPSAPQPAAHAGGAHHCLVCGAEVQPGWAECGECQTPLPESYRETTTQQLIEPAVAPTPPEPEAAPVSTTPPEPSVPAPVAPVARATAPAAAPTQCASCGTELDPEWTECGECQTPVPSARQSTLTELPVSEGIAETSPTAAVAAVLAVLGLCIPLVPFIAVFLGMSAMRQIEESAGRKGGQLLAQTGIYFGGVMALIQTLVLLFGGQSVMVAMTGGGEDMGLGALKKLYHAEAMARFSVAVDADKDGLGEFMELAKLGEGSLPFLRSDLADGSVGGYQLLVVLPQGADFREKDWWGIAQPQLKSKGWRTFVVDSSGVIRARDTQGAEVDLNSIESWVEIDMVMSQYDDDVQAAHAAVAAAQARTARGARDAEHAYPRY